MKGTNEMKKLMILLIAFAMAATLVAAPAQFAYQGVLKDTNGAALSGTKQVELRLYNVASGGTALWGRMYNVQLDANGLFNIEVSDTMGTELPGFSGRSLDETFAKTETVFIGIKVANTSGEIVPRQKLLPVPFAAVASNVSRASGDFSVSGRLTAQSAAFSGELTAASLNVSSSATVGALTTGVATVTGDLTVGGTISGFGTAPIGGIIMWSGAQSAIPTGWQLCDGSYSVSETGGEENVTLKLENIPSHNHMYKYSGASLAGIGTSDNTFYKVGSSGSNVAFTEYAGGKNGNGATVAHNNMPPFYALCYIMRIR